MINSLAYLNAFDIGDDNAAYVVARSLLADGGPWSRHCTLIGALVPRLLVPRPQERLTPHHMAQEVSLALNVNAWPPTDEMAASLRRDLWGLGLQQSESDAALWQGLMRGGIVRVVLYAAVDDPAQDGKLQSHRSKGGDKLALMGLYGLGFLPLDRTVVADVGPWSHERSVTCDPLPLPVCGAAMFLSLKAWATARRQETISLESDAYDIVWMLKSLGPQTIATRFRDAGLHQVPFGIEALGHLSRTFESHHHDGPLNWVEHSGFEGDEAAREARDASGLVREFVELACGVNNGVDKARK